MGRKGANQNIKIEDCVDGYLELNKNINNPFFTRQYLDCANEQSLDLSNSN